MDSTRALDGLDQRPWPGLEHAYGTAEDVPDLLRALTGEDEEEAEEALEELWSSIVHQGTVYPATVEAVPFLARLAAAGCCTTSLLGMLAVAAEGSDDCCAAVGAQLPLLLPLLEAPEAEVRRAAIWAVGRTEEAGAAEAVGRRYRGEPDGSVRAELLSALIRLDPAGGTELIAEALDPGEPAELRLAAVLAGLEAGVPWSAEQHAALLAVLPANGLLEPGLDEGRDAPLAAVCSALLERDTDKDRAAAFGLLTAALGDAREDVREEALWAADDAVTASRSAPGVLLPLLAPVLDGPTPSAAAMRLLLRLAESLDDSLVEPLVRLAAGEGDLADQALTVLVRAAPERAAPLLAARLADRPGALRTAAGLEGAFPFSGELLAAVRELLASTPERRPDEPLYAMTQRHNQPIHLALLLGQWGERAAPALPELLAALGRASLVVPKVLAGLALEGAARTAAVDALRAAAGSGGTDERLAAARAVYRIDGDPAPLLAALEEALAGEDPYRLRAAVGVAGELGSAALPLLRGLADDGGRELTAPALRADLAVAVAEALWELDGDEVRAVRLLGSAFPAADDLLLPWSAVHAARLVARIGAPAAGLRPVLEGLLEKPEQVPAAVVGLAGLLRREELDGGLLADRLLDGVEVHWRPETVLDALEALGPLDGERLGRLAALAERDRRVVRSGADVDLVVLDERFRDRVRALVQAFDRPRGAKADDDAAS
ncbi:hypothetical protein [Streptomyces smaragdinus]|nr:hypothetical protein [Streptomyces smaragdinus]